MQKRMLLRCLSIITVIFYGCHLGTDSQKAIAIEGLPDTVGLPPTIQTIQWSQQFNGVIDQNLFITMHLNRRGKVVTGTYYYDRLSKLIQVEGQISGDSLCLTEFLQRGRPTGYFKGILNDRGYTGEWNSTKKPSKLSFRLSLISDSSLVVNLEEYFETDCSTRDSILKEGITEDLSYFDTLCWTFSATKMTIGGLRPAVNKLLNKTIEIETLKQVQNEMGNNSSLLAFVNSVKGNNANVSIGVNINYRNQRILSLSFYNDFYGGGAHPIHYEMNHTYDLSTGQEIRLEDLFVDSFLAQINAVGEIEFLKQNGEQAWNFETGAFNLPSNYSITPDGVLFVFNQYEIGPYAAGMPSVFMAFADYKKHLKPLVQKLK